MKTATLSLLCSGVLLCAGAAAQTLTASGMNPVPGDQMTIVGSGYVSPGSAGASQTWNLSSMPASTGNTTTVVTPSSTPYGGSFPMANAASSGSGGYGYFNGSSTALQNMGVVSPNGVVISYTNPEDMLHFPFAYQNTYSDAWNGTFVSASYTYYRRGSTTVTADGYGTLITPAGTYNNVMRVHFVQNYQDSTNIQSMPYVITYQNDEYMWYLNGNHTAIAAVYTFQSSLSGSSQYGLYMTNVVSGVAENDVISSFGMSPNPASEQVKFSLGLTAQQDVQVALYDASGRLVDAPLQAAGFAGENSYTLDVAELPAGIYFAAVLVNGEIRKTEKLAVTHGR